MNLYFVHCGFYDEDLSDGIYEFHVNIPIVATNVEEAKLRVRRDPSFVKKKMHIDGIQEVRAVDGFCVKLEKSPEEVTDISPIPYRDL